ncbi:MAG: hypothetical protein RL084_1613, partial [Pseudomonadota bacterium]
FEWPVLEPWLARVVELVVEPAHLVTVAR